MVQFIFSNSSKGSERLISRTVRLDSKGRVSIPSELRKNFGLKEGSLVEVVFDPSENLVFLLFDGRDSVTVSTEGCEPSGPGENPGPGPKMQKRLV